jgi:hypothetical protein
MTSPSAELLDVGRVAQEARVALAMLGPARRR